MTLKRILKFAFILGRGKLALQSTHDIVLLS